MNSKREIVRNIPILNIAQRLGIRINKNKKALCFAHREKTPSLSFDPRRNIFKCFGCEIKGDVISLVQMILKISYRDAVQWLSDEYLMGRQYNTVGNRRRQLSPTISILPRKKETEGIDGNPDPEVYEWIVDTCILGEIAKAFLIGERKLSESTLKSLRIISIEDPRIFFKDLINVWGAKRLFAAGLINKDKIEPGTNPFTTFIWRSPVIVFPFLDQNRRIVFLQGRRLDKGDPRYLNLGRVRTSLFNLNMLAHLEHGQVVYICEGVTDALIAYQSGLNVVGVIGAMGFKNEWVNYFLNYEICIIPDRDNAGSRFASDISNKMNSIGKPTRILDFPNGKDLSEFVIQGGKQIK